MSEPDLSSFIWSVADLLRGDYKRSEYGRVILPFTVLHFQAVQRGLKDILLNSAGLWEALRAAESSGPPPIPL